MGLEIVEIVMALEEEFGVEIDDRDAGKLGRVGEMSDYVARKLRQQGVAVDEEQVWNRVKRIVIEQSGVKSEEVTRQAHFVYDLKCD